MASLSQCSHELVELGDEFLFYTFGPVLFTKELGEEFSIHLVKQVVERVSIDNTNEKDVLDVGRKNKNIKDFLQEEAYLKLSNVDVHF
jgi:hypothetical protein